MNFSIIDTNVNLSRWPFRRLYGDETGELVKKLKSKNVTQAWAGSFDAILHCDVADVNGRLVEMCKKDGQGILLPFGSINPTIPDWQKDLRRCCDDYKMKGIRLYPNYHNYLLDDGRFLKTLEIAEKNKIIVQIAVTMEDVRTQHPLVQVPVVETKPLEKISARFPNLSIQLLNALRSIRSERAGHLAENGNIYFEIARLEGVGGIEKLLKKVPLPNLLFGSHFPFFVFESALLKLKESGLEDHQLRAICSENAGRLI